MDEERKQTKWKRLFGRKKEPLESKTTSVQNAVPAIEVSPDRRRTMERYQQAAKLLEDAVNGRGDTWGGFDVSLLDGEPEDFNDSQFRDKVNAVLDARKDTVESRSAWTKCCRTFQCAFVAFSPFAKNFLAIAKEAQSVCPVYLMSLTCIDSHIKSIRIACRRLTLTDYRISSKVCV
jgi:hypothetical protein